MKKIDTMIELLTRIERHLYTLVKSDERAEQRYEADCRLLLDDCKTARAKTGTVIFEPINPDQPSTIAKVIHELKTMVKAKD